MNGNNTVVYALKIVKSECELKMELFANKDMYNTNGINISMGIPNTKCERITFYNFVHLPWGFNSKFNLNDPKRWKLKT